MELLQNLIGKNCEFYLQGAMSAVVGTVLAAEDNWLSVQCGTVARTLNADYVTQIRVREPKAK